MFDGVIHLLEGSPLLFGCKAVRGKHPDIPTPGNIIKIKPYTSREINARFSKSLLGLLFYITTTSLIEPLCHVQNLNSYYISCLTYYKSLIIIMIFLRNGPEL